MYAFGKVMRRLIEKHDVTQADIVRATGLSKQNVSWMCAGKTQYPGIHACKRILASTCNKCKQCIYVQFYVQVVHGVRPFAGTWDAAGTQKSPAPTKGTGPSRLSVTALLTHHEREARGLDHRGDHEPPDGEQDHEHHDLGADHATIHDHPPNCAATTITVTASTTPISHA